MKSFTPKPQTVLLSMLIIASVSILVSCSTTKEMAKESLIESISDSRTGTQVFVRKYDTEPYGINAGGIIKARKDAKKKKQRTYWRITKLKGNSEIF